MKKVLVKIHNKRAGILEEISRAHYVFTYLDDYHGAPLSLTMPITSRKYEFKTFPPFFDGLLPEGFQLEGLLRQHKIDRHDYFSQLISVGNDVVGAITVEEITTQNE